MAEWGELSLSLRVFLRAYRWRRIDPVPWTPLEKPLSQCRVALASSAGLVLDGQEPFDGSVRGGDVSLRFIPRNAATTGLLDTHRSSSFDHAGVRQDANVAFPLDRIRELEESGRIGSVASSHLSFMGSITAPGRLIRETAPRAARRLVEEGVDACLLVPV